MYSHCVCAFLCLQTKTISTRKSSAHNRQQWTACALLLAFSFSVWTQTVTTRRKEQHSYIHFLARNVLCRWVGVSAQKIKLIIERLSRHKMNKFCIAFGLKRVCACSCRLLSPQKEKPITCLKKVFTEWPSMEGRIVGLQRLRTAKIAHRNTYATIAWYMDAGVRATAELWSTLASVWSSSYLPLFVKCTSDSLFSFQLNRLVNFSLSTVQVNCSLFRHAN